MGVFCVGKYKKFLELFQFWNIIIYTGELAMNYITAEEAAKKWGISSRRVRILCNEGRIEGAEIKGNLWLIPDTVNKPEQYKRGIKHKPN